MTCFWKGIIKELGSKRIKNFLESESKVAIHKNKIIRFIELLKQKNIETVDVRWQNKEISDLELKQNIIHIENIDVKKINDGYDCSTCDPVLLLICQLFQVNIFHDYDGIKIEYINKKLKDNTNKLNFISDINHFEKL
ncbi:MAG: hypothetical protein Edafosvirus34_4 [Edafosvirus sp.]|uniref:Uncharacterized protein n=1 Tax=Edafosvirus sp. TaxID=2487765 RepID=A0A3G4ZWR5_9VIRU|nr:MAG: hypothetical protein Edafosvirus34_4 [Edafosvirus sp.]